MPKPLGKQDDWAQRAKLSRDRRLEVENRIQFPTLVKKFRLWDRQFRAKIPRINKPWDHATDFNPPLTLSKVLDVAAALHGFVNENTFFRLAPAAKQGVAMEVMKQRAQKQDDLLKWSLRNEINSSSFYYHFILNGCIFGHGAGEACWNRDIRSVQNEYPLPEEVSEGTSDRDIIRAALGDKLLSKRIKEQDRGRYSIDFIDEDAEEKTGIAWVDHDHPNRDEPSVFVERDKAFRDAPTVSLVQPWDIIAPSDVTSLQTARRYWVRKFLSYDEIVTGWRSGLYNGLTKENRDKLAERAKKDNPNLTLSDVSGSSIGSHDEVITGRDLDLGMSVTESRRDLFECWFEYAFEDLDGDERPESIVRAVLEPDAAPMLLMEHRVEYLYPHGRRPHFDWHFLPVSDRYYGMGLCEMLEDAQSEESAFYQSRSDILEIITKPGGMYDPMSGLAPDAITFSPGLLVKANLQSTAYQPWVFPVDPSLLFREQSGIELQAERVAGSTDMGAGRGPTRPNAPRTLGGTAILVRQGQLRTNVHVNLLLLGRSPEHPSGIAEFLQQYRDLYVAFMPRHKEFRVLGTEDVESVSREDLQGRYDFVIDFSEEMNNPQLRMQNAILAYDRALPNPIFQQNPAAMWEITMRLMEATGWRSARRSVPVPQGMGDRPPLAPEEVLQLISKGIPIEPIPQEDHGAMLQAIAELLQDQRRLAMFPTRVMPLLERYAMRTMEFLQVAQVTPGTQNRLQQTIGGNGQAQGGGAMQEQVAQPIEGVGPEGL